MNKEKTNKKHSHLPMCEQKTKTKTKNLHGVLKRNHINYHTVFTKYTLLISKRGGFTLSLNPFLFLSIKTGLNTQCQTQCSYSG